MNQLNKILRAQGCFLGQVAGDSLGSLVEFQNHEAIIEKYPNGLRELKSGGFWRTLAGQPTDDSEMAILLARSIVKNNGYYPEEALKSYQYWYNSNPFDCGFTISSALNGRLNKLSQANGAMMRVSPLGVFGSNYNLTQVADWSIQDCKLTHPNIICIQANALYTMAVSYAVKVGPDPLDIYKNIVTWAKGMCVESILLETILKSKDSKPLEYCNKQGWVLIALQNTLWQLLHAVDLEEGIVDTVMNGGDTDTNGAICGALLGAVYSKDAVPQQWVDCILTCKPDINNPSVVHARPKNMWPIDILDLSEKLVS